MLQEQREKGGAIRLIRVLIGDDQAAMRNILKKAIEKTEGFQVVAEAEDGEAVLSSFEQIRPDVVFLDIEMPKVNGLLAARKICDINPKTIIIFATAHEEFMAEAFEIYAFDYLVKPFKLDRIYQSVKRIKEVKNNIYDDSLVKIIRHEKGLEKILIKNKESVSFIDTKDIILILREDRSTLIYTKDSSFTSSDGLSELEEKLDKTQFFRCHKSYIVNLSMIEKIYPYGRWTYIIKLKNTDKDALVTHDKYDELKNIFGF